MNNFIGKLNARLKYYFAFFADLLSSFLEIPRGELSKSIKITLMEFNLIFNCIRLA